MIPMTTRLHIILILTIIAVAVYMFLLYKELRIFEKDILQLRAQVNSLTMNMTDLKAKCVAPGPPQQCMKPVADTTAIENVEIDQDDDDSVASDEIRDLIDTIHNKDSDKEDEEEQLVLPEHSEQEPVQDKEETEESEPVKPTADDEQPTTSSVSIKDMDEDELNGQGMDALKTFLKQQGVAIKGRSTKRDLIQHILHLRKENEQSEDDV